MHPTGAVELQTFVDQPKLFLAFEVGHDQARLEVTPFHANEREARGEHGVENPRLVGVRRKALRRRVAVEGSLAPALIRVERQIGHERELVLSVENQLSPARNSEATRLLQQGFRGQAFEGAAVVRFADRAKPSIAVKDLRT